MRIDGFDRVEADERDPSLGRVAMGFVIKSDKGPI